ncbi:MULTISPECIES: phage virion morphogenesis protein [Pseudomonas]|jgi:phage virion morphogenesis protein|uniref:phage virion morphogenesis protein n=1 Tax=Pseudomonas TaxID=286 RepID=UPI00049B424F|nr:MULTISPECIES: phage virion morphogenesis protein [Pseudomonas]AHZ80012.1 phage virion morphogenesis protein [Pseudomonas putida]AHZ80132.1 phage virion morphogenesis protein [Pseudomonas putida]AVH35410.1 phage virion morphogenesis protein [Pseudomonas monteilii]MDT3716058.1 phage virion morphogenesis protein [Pseudomonas soli]MDT3732858.1 phage virion morphogenesis protein [Pseudomonas soli]
MITIELDHQRVQEVLRQVEWAVGDLAPLMRGIAAEFASITEENFEAEAQGDDPWQTLSEVTTARREATSTWPGQMLQVSAGGLAASVTTQATDSSALVGSNKVYAAMMHFGGSQEAFPHLWGDIPARPYLPMDAEGKLQPEAEDSILDLALGHLEKAARQ